MKLDPITVARFWSKVDVGRRKECWPWTGATRKGGYGNFKVGTTSRSAHRIALELFQGKPLGSAVAAHLCDNPACCNPHHISESTISENLKDSYARGERGSRPPAIKRKKNRLSAGDAFLIRREMMKGLTNAQLSRATGLSSNCMHHLRQNISHRDIWPRDVSDNDYLSAWKKARRKARQADHPTPED